MALTTINRPDDQKALFGTGNDLDIYHDGSHSWVNNSTGNLYLRGSEVVVAGSTTGEYLAHFVENGAAILRYDNSVKLETISTGAAVTGSLGIGTSSPTGTLSIASGTYQSTTPESTADDIVISGNQSLGLSFLTLASGSSNNNIVFGDTDDVNIGMIRYAHSDNSLQFTTNAEEKLRIDSSGDVLVGLTSTPSANGTNLWVSDGTVARIGIEKTGTGACKTTIGVGSDRAFNIYNETADHEILRGETDGDVKITTGNLIIGTAGKGIDFSATSDGSGTMSSELLDDYEEGTWTPAINPASGSVTSYHTQDGGYTKIGRMVKCHFRLRVNDAGSASGAMEVSGLPFTVGDTLSSTGLDGSGGPTYWAAMQNTIVNMSIVPSGGTTIAYIYVATAAITTIVPLTDSNAFGDGWDVRAEMMYFV